MVVCLQTEPEDAHEFLVNTADIVIGNTNAIHLVMGRSVQIRESFCLRYDILNAAYTNCANSCRSMLVFGSERGRYVHGYKSQSGPYAVMNRVGDQGRQNMYYQFCS